ncbi:MAG: hypothetical protein WCH74_13180 [Chloroflexota bacterium]
MAAKFFVNSGIVTGRADILNLLRPLLKQTVSYTYLRGREVVTAGTGWVERIVSDEPETSTYFTPLVVCLNIDSFEHLEFETRPDQLLSYTLVQGDERVRIEFASLDRAAGSSGDRQLTLPDDSFVQMELTGLEADDA